MRTWTRSNARTLTEGRFDVSIVGRENENVYFLESSSDVRDRWKSSRGNNDRLLGAVHFRGARLAHGLGNGSASMGDRPGIVSMVSRR